MQNFRDLRVWRKSHGLAVDTRRSTKLFPRSGYSSLRDQILRAAESIPSNIAEGCGASTAPEFARFLDISIKSSLELDAQLELARDYGVLPEAKWTAHAKTVEDVRKMLCALRKKVLATASPEAEPPPEN